MLRLLLRVLLSASPGPLYAYHEEVPGWMHADMWIMPLDARLAMIYPPWCDYQTIRDLHEIGYTLIEAPREEVNLYPTNGITLEPRKVIMNASAVKTRKLLEQHKVDVIPIEYDEVHKYGGGIRCNTMQLIRDPGPRTFDLANVCGLPAGAGAVSLNVTVTSPTHAGNLRIYPGGPTPLVSVINYAPGQTRANNAIAVLSSTGSVTVQCDQAGGSVELILDINGYFR